MIKGLFVTSDKGVVIISDLAVKTFSYGDYAEDANATHITIQKPTETLELGLTKTEATKLCKQLMRELGLDKPKPTKPKAVKRR